MRRRSRTCPRRQGSGSAGADRAAGRCRSIGRPDRAPRAGTWAAWRRPPPPGRPPPPIRTAFARDRPPASKELVSWPSRDRLPGDLICREHGALAADSLRTIDADDRTAQAGANSATHVLFHRNLQEGLAASGGGTKRILRAATLAAELGHTQTVAPAGGQRRQTLEHRMRPAGEGLGCPGLVIGHEFRSET